jgi:glycosyltransferase involved in cell wall biosynthesis
MQKILLFDLVATQPNSSGKRHGGGRYGEIIFFRIAERGLPIACFYDSRKWLNPEVKDVIDKNQYPLFDIAQNSIEEIIKQSNAGCLYSALPSSNLFHLKGIKVYGTLHGLRELETPSDSFYWKYKHTTYEKVRTAISRLFPKWWYKRVWNKYNQYFISNMDVITVSSHSKSSISSYYPHYKKNLPVFFSPNTSSSFPAKKDDKREKYFLMVSGNRSEKNNLRAIMAFDRLVSAGKMNDIKAVVTGCSAENFHYKIQNPDSFKFYGYVEERVLEDLYANAFVFVYPSLNEGFGYPPLEAMRYGIPVIASPFSSISEVLEEAALYFNPFSVEEIMSRMLLMMDEQRYQQYAAKGRKKFEQISSRQKEDLDALIDYLYN